MTTPPLGSDSALDRRDRRPLTIRDERDVLALVPYVLGFHPQDSLVMLTTGSSSTGRGPFHARIDLPDDPSYLEEVVSHLVHAVRRNGAGPAVLVAYTHDACLGEAATTLLEQRLAGHDVPVALSVRADGSRWFRIGDEEDAGEPYDVRSHPITAMGVLDGKVTYGSRGELEGSLLPGDPDEIEEVALAAASTPTPAGAQVAAEGEWVAHLVKGLLDDGRELPAPEVARLLVGLHSVQVRDAAWATVTAENAEAHVRVWRPLVRRSPHHLVAPAASLLAFAAWLAGDGALAWCAVDRAREADPDYRLAALVAHALEHAVPPSAWRDRDETASDAGTGGVVGRDAS